MLPELKDLKLIMALHLKRRDIEWIGTSCPKLESFTYHEYWIYSRIRDGEDYSPNDQALAVAAAMPNLQELQLIENPKDNDRLRAILAGCTNLKTLDLRVCNNLDLTGELAERCLEKISKVKLPSDSTADLVEDVRLDT